MTAPGWRQNMVLGPDTAHPFTRLFLVGPASYCLGDTEAWLTGGGARKEINCIGQGGHWDGAQLGRCFLDINTPGIGGIDHHCFPPGSGAYWRQPNTLYNTFVVGRDSWHPTNDPDGAWLIAVPGSGPYGRAVTLGPSATFQETYPLYCPMGFFWTDETGTKMRWLISKSDHDWVFTGAPGHPTNFPVIASGTTNGTWAGAFSNPATPEFGSSHNTGKFTVALHCQTPGTYVDLANTIHSGAGFEMSRATPSSGRHQAVIIPDQGSLGYRSTDPNGLAFLVGGYDGF